MIIPLMVALIILLLNVFSTNKGLHLDNEKSSITWFRNEDKIELNIFIKNEMPKEANFYLYINQKDNELANTFNFGLFPVENGKLFNLSRNEEEKVSISFDLPEDAVINEQHLLDGYEVIIGYLKAPKKEKQSTFNITEVHFK